MKKRLWALSACLMIAAGGVQAGTIQENLGFPDMNAFVSQKDNDSANSVWRTDDSLGGAIGGQSFKLDAETTLRAITFQKQGTKTFAESPSEILLFVGEYTNGVMASTNLIETFDVSGYTMTNLYYYSLNLDDDLVLDAGTYAYQIWFNQASESHTLTMKVGASSTYTNGNWFWKSSTTNFPIPSYTESTAVGKDYTFGLHNEVVGTIPTVVTLSSDQIDMSFTLDLDGTAGNTSIGYSTVSGSNVVVSSISISDETHAGAFSNLTVLPLVMSNALPATTSLAFNFDNTVAGLTNGETATATATIDWMEEGGTNGQFLVALSVTAREPLPASSISNTGSTFPTNDVLVGQEVFGGNGQTYLAGTASTKLGSGQTFTLDGNKYISGFSVYVTAGKTFDDGTHLLNVWLGAEDGTTAGETLHLSSIDLSGYSFTQGSYYRIDFAEEIYAEAGTYAFQMAWANEDPNHAIRFGNSTTNVYDGGTGLRFGSDGALPKNGGSFAWDLAFAIHGVDGPEGYNAWLLNYDLGAYTNATDNPDGDAYDNLYEYAMGGDPTNSADIGYMTPLSYQLLEDGTTNWFEYVYARRIAASNELVYALEMSDNLAIPNWMLGTYVELPTTGIMPEDAEFETVTNLVDMTGKNVEFIRVNVDEL
ncbi:hypothetical protein P4E94_02765 [Pontiellaceae bacterium B12219]|nr:hypothetical protein [Pontiellaceae bacterium B12219]